MFNIMLLTRRWGMLVKPKCFYLSIFIIAIDMICCFLNYFDIISEPKNEMKEFDLIDLTTVEKIYIT